MIETLISWDKELFLLLNGYHSGTLDTIMYYISNKFLWLPLYALLIYWIIIHYKRNSLWILLTLILLITISDQLSVHAFKNVFMRLRPCHDPGLEGLVHTVRGKCGGPYGFYSSHASNHFAIAVFMSFILGSRIRFFTPIILSWAAVVSYSRIYLGVHFPLDVIAGALAGSMLGFLAFRLLKWSKPSILFGNQGKDVRKAKPMAQEAN